MFIKKVNGEWSMVNGEESCVALGVHKEESRKWKSSIANSNHHLPFTIYHLRLCWQEGNPQGRSEAVIEPA
jgi:hypothetical protein